MQMHARCFIPTSHELSANILMLIRTFCCPYALLHVHLQ